jgi:hypothetical protein
MTRARDVANIDGILTTKGDIYAATAAATPARLGVGSNGDTIVADSSTSTGLRYQTGFNGNAIINGGFDIWQRGTTFGPFNAIYTADRYLSFRGGVVQGQTVSRQASGLTGIQYSLRAQRNSGNTSVEDMYTSYALESADSYRFAGQTVTLSFYAKVGANFSNPSSRGFVFLYSGTGTDQTIFSGFTGNTTVASSTTLALTTSWQRFSITGTVASSATQLGLLMGYTPSGTAGANDWIEFTGVQLELGSVPTNFKRSSAGGGTIQGETSACQRYYYRSSPGTAYGLYAWARGYSTAGGTSLVNFPVQMRIVPTSVDYANLRISDTGTGGTAATTVAIVAGESATLAIQLDIASTTFRDEVMFVLQNNNNTTGYLGFSAEL